MMGQGISPPFIRISRPARMQAFACKASAPLRELRLIPRYTRPEMGRVWSEENQFQKWLEVELAATETLAEAASCRATQRRNCASARASMSRASTRSKPKCATT